MDENEFYDEEHGFLCYCDSCACKVPIYQPCRHIIFAADTVNHEISTFNDDFRKILTEIFIKNEDCEEDLEVLWVKVGDYVCFVNDADLERVSA